MGLKKKRLEPELGVNQGFASAQWSAPPCWQRCQVPCCWRRSPEGLVPACSIPFEGSPAFPAPVPLLQRGAVLEQDGLLLALGVDLGICGIHICSQRPSLFLMCCLHKNQKYIRCHTESKPLLSLAAEHWPWLLQPFSQCGAAPQSRQGWCKCLTWAETRTVVVPATVRDMDHFWGSASRKTNATPCLSHLFPLQLSSSLCHSHCPFSNVELHYDQVGTRCGAGLKLGHVPGNLPSLPFCPPEQARECTLPVRGSPGFAYPFCQFHWSSKQPRGLLSPEPDSRAGAPSVCLTCSLPGEGLCLCNLYSPLSLFPGVQVPTWLLVYPSYLIPYASIGVSLLVSS